MAGGFGLNDTIAIAIRILQHHQEIVEHWHATNNLLQRLGLLPPGTTPVRATHNYSVEWVQQSLNTVQGAGLQIDGRMGTKTFEAVQRYQSSRGLDPDGWAGMLTLAALERDMIGRN